MWVFFTMHASLFILSHFIVDLLFKISKKILGSQFFFSKCIFFSQINLRKIKSNLLTKNKIKKHETKVEKTP
jgi:hypothetical protein